MIQSTHVWLSIPLRMFFSRTRRIETRWTRRNIRKFLIQCFQNRLLPCCIVCLPQLVLQEFRVCSDGGIDICAIFVRVSPYFYNRLCGGFHGRIGFDIEERIWIEKTIDCFGIAPIYRHGPRIVRKPYFFRNVPSHRRVFHCDIHSKLVKGCIVACSFVHSIWKLERIVVCTKTLSKCVASRFQSPERLEQLFTYRHTIRIHIRTTILFGYLIPNMPRSLNRRMLKYKIGHIYTVGPIGKYGIDFQKGFLVGLVLDKVGLSRYAYIWARIGTFILPMALDHQIGWLMWVVYNVYKRKRPLNKSIEKRKRP